MMRGVLQTPKIQYISNLIKATKKDVIQVVDVLESPAYIF